MADKKTFYAIRTFFWEGKNINIGDPVELSELDAKWMLARKSVTDKKPAKAASKKK